MLTGSKYPFLEVEKGKKACDNSMAIQATVKQLIYGPIVGGEEVRPLYTDLGYTSGRILDV